MGLEKLNDALNQEVKTLETQGRKKISERIICDYAPPNGNKGSRYFLEGHKEGFIRMNSNNYLSLSHHPSLIEAADKASRKLGVGPGAVRFIDGTFSQHIHLEKLISEFTEMPSAKIFNSAYTSNLALALTLSSEHTYWIGDELNHNSIIRAMRIANVPREQRSFFKHNDIDDLDRCLSQIPKNIRRVCVIFDGVFSMRGDSCPMREIKVALDAYHDKFEEGVISIVDDSHGIGAYGDTGRGTCEYTGVKADIIIGTFGKAFGVNGGFIAGSRALSEVIRQKADTYIYTNPLSMADCAACIESINLLNSSQGLGLLDSLRKNTHQFRSGVKELGLETIQGTTHPIVPVLIRDAQKTQKVVKLLFENYILAVGLTFPVVPKGSETLRIQINSGLSTSDIDYVLDCLERFKV